MKHGLQRHRPAQTHGLEGARTRGVRVFVGGVVCCFVREFHHHPWHHHPRPLIHPSPTQQPSYSQSWTHGFLTLPSYGHSFSCLLNSSPQNEGSPLFYCVFFLKSHISSHPVMLPTRKNIGTSMTWGWRRSSCRAKDWQVSFSFNVRKKRRKKACRRGYLLDSTKPCKTLTNRKVRTIALTVPDVIELRPSALPRPQVLLQ